MQHRILAWLLIALMLLSTGCGAEPDLGAESQSEENTVSESESEAPKISVGETVLLNEGEVTEISVTSLPPHYEYSFTGEDAEPFVEYFSSLHLISDFSENPDQYAGMMWVVSLKYADGSTVTLYHFGNMFIKKVYGGESSGWYKMQSDEAHGLDTLLQRTESDE